MFRAPGPLTAARSLPVSAVVSSIWPRMVWSDVPHQEEQHEVGPGQHRQPGGRGELRTPHRPTQGRGRPAPVQSAGSPRTGGAGRTQWCRGGTLALVGSGEYPASMLEVERGLLEGRPPRYVQIPTAATRVRAARVLGGPGPGAGRPAGRRGGAAGRRRPRRGPRPGDRRAGRGSRADLPLRQPSALLARDPSRHRLVARGGRGLGGRCGAGRVQRGRDGHGRRRARPAHPAGIGSRGSGCCRICMCCPISTGWRTGARPDLQAVPGSPGVHLVGVDEDTALVGGPEVFTVQGQRSAWLLSEGPRREFPSSSTIQLTA